MLGEHEAEDVINAGRWVERMVSFLSTRKQTEEHILIVQFMLLLERNHFLEFFKLYLDRGLSG